MGVTIDLLKCTGCGACVYVCPVGVLMVEDDMKAHVSEGCIACGLCVDRCHWRAITLEDSPGASKRGASPSSSKSPPLRRRRGGHRGRG